MTEYIYEEIVDSDGITCYIKRGDVVRCKDCRYLEEYRKDAVPVGEVAVYRTMQGWRCMRFPTIYSFVEKEDFCSYGERKGGEDE